MIWTHTFSFRGKTIHWKLQILDTPRYPTKGLSARIPETCQFILFMDYDNVRDPRLKEELVDLQELFEVSDFHVLQTSEYARHAICLDRMSMREALSILWDSTCDYNFQRGIKLNEYRSWILRYLPKGSRPKPVYLYTVYSEHNGKHYLQSEAHAEFLREHYGINVRLANPDGNHNLQISPDGKNIVKCTAVEIQEYLTSTKTNIKKLGERK